MKKVIAILLAIGMVLAFAACAKPAADDPGTAVDPDAGTYEIVLVTDVGNIDDASFNQGSWEGVKAYAEENGKTYNYFRPSEDTTEARVETIKTAIDKGAKVVVCPGFLFEDAIYEVQSQFPEVQFLLIDGEPHTADYSVYETTANTHCILYQEEQAGYFAGYAAVKDGYTKLGFLGGMAVPAVIRYGYGFVQGANDAAKELGNTADIEIKYWYCGGFGPTDDIKTKMSGWFTEGTEIVFSCGGKIYQSALAAAEEAGAKLIGVDVDQAGESDLIVTSAMKELKTSVILSLTDLYANGGTWPEAYAGKTANLGVADNCVGLPTAEGSWRFNSFTVEEYNALFEAVKAGAVAISNAIDVEPAVDIAVDYQK
jgi:basic membrane protein A